jgi:triphosphoribosyl-dephospho-CoA synthase
VTLPENIAHCAYRASVMEASAEKPGNVTPTHSFEGLYYSDFLRAAQDLEQYIERAAREGEGAQIGKLIYEATSKTKNVNFGIVLMFMPLAASHGRGTQKIIKSLGPIDTKWIVQAMQKGRLGGMGLKDEHLNRYDVFSKDILKTIDEEVVTPLQLMRMSAPYDTLAAEWVNDYALSRQISKRIEEDPHSIVNTFLWVLSKYPDTLIARKAGMETAKDVSKKAGDVLNGLMGPSDLDMYLRLEGNKLNPGTTADLIATGLFLKLIS